MLMPSGEADAKKGATATAACSVSMHWHWQHASMRGRRVFVLRLVMAAISEIPFDLEHQNKLFDLHGQNIFFTLLLGYLAWMNRTEALKLLFLPLLSFYYLSIYIGWRDRRTLIAVAVCLVLAAAFHWYKLRRRKDAEDQQENHHQEG